MTISNLASAGYPSRSASVAMGRSAYFRAWSCWLASRLVRIRWLLLGVALLVLAGCQGGGSNDAASSVAPTTAATVTAAPPGACPPFAGSTTTLQSVGPTAPASLTDATAGADGCLDRVTFTLRSLGNGTPPGYAVGYQDPAKDRSSTVTRRHRSRYPATRTSW